LCASSKRPFAGVGRTGKGDIGSLSWLPATLLQAIKKALMIKAFLRIYGARGRLEVLAAGAVVNGFVCFGSMMMPLKMPLKWKAPRPEVGRFHRVCSLNSLRCVVAAKSSRSGTRLELPRHFVAASPVWGRSCKVAPAWGRECSREAGWVSNATGGVSGLSNHYSDQAQAHATIALVEVA